MNTKLGQVTDFNLDGRVWALIQYKDDILPV